MAVTLDRDRQYITNVYIKLKDSTLPINLRHRIALFSWSNDDVFLPPNKQKILLDFIQQAIVDSKPADLELWLTFRYFLQCISTSHNDSLQCSFLVHRKLGQSILLALNDKDDEIKRCCMDCIDFSDQLISTILPQTFHQIIVKLATIVATKMNQQTIEDRYKKLVIKLVQHAYDQASSDKDIELLLKRLKVLPSEFDTELSHIVINLQLDGDALLVMLFRHKPEYIFKYCCNGKLDTIGKVVTMACTRFKQDKRWWDELLDRVLLILSDTNNASFRQKKIIRHVDLLKTIDVYPQLAPKAIQLYHDMYHLLPTELANTDLVQSTFIKSSSNTTLSQLLAIKGLPCGPLSLEAIGDKAVTSDKLEIVQCILKYDRTIIDLLLSKSNLCNIAFVPDSCKLALRRLEPLMNSDGCGSIIRKACLMLASDTVQCTSNSAEDYVEYNCRFNQNSVTDLEYWHLWKTKGTLLSRRRNLYTVMYGLCKNRKYMPKVISDYAAMYFSNPEEMPFCVDVFQSVSDLEMFLYKFLDNAAMNEESSIKYEALFNEVSYCKLSNSDLTLKLLQMYTLKMSHKSSQ
ncbi:hypothetical protein GJ496_002578, partial [Pomphorhynchus laevis]